jgi:quercetin dioxygenase-like cupin family protein
MTHIRAEAKTSDIPAIIRPEKSFRVVHMDVDTPSDRPLLITRLAEAPGLQVKHLTIQAHESLPAHWTPKHLFLYCVSGQGVFTVDGADPVPLAPGTGLMIDPQLTHAIHADTTCHVLLFLHDTQKEPQPETSSSQRH